MMIPVVSDPDLAALRHPRINNDTIATSGHLVQGFIPELVLQCHGVRVNAREVTRAVREIKIVNVYPPVLLGSGRMDALVGEV